VSGNDTKTSARAYEIWEDQPAANRGSDWDIVKARGMPYDEDWEHWSYPLGNGFMGACIFARLMGTGVLSGYPQP
jgi:alpha-L-fucosidase 2